MKNFLFGGFCLVVLSVLVATSFGQALPGLSTPSKVELESTISGMGLSMAQKLSLRTILQAMQEQGTQVKADDSLSDEQKVAQIVKIRRNALDQTNDILNASQQKQLAALFLPNA